MTHVDRELGVLHCLISFLFPANHEIISLLPLPCMPAGGRAARVEVERCSLMTCVTFSLEQEEEVTCTRTLMDDTKAQ